MRQVFTPVQPIPNAAKPHPREGQAGVVYAVPANDPDHVGIKWDTDQVVTVEACADLRQLA